MNMDDFSYRQQDTVKLSTIVTYVSILDRYYNPEQDGMMTEHSIPFHPIPPTKIRSQLVLSGI